MIKTKIPLQFHADRLLEHLNKLAIDFYATIFATHRIVIANLLHNWKSTLDRKVVA